MKKTLITLVSALLFGAGSMSAGLRDTITYEYYGTTLYYTYQNNNAMVVCPPKGKTYTGIETLIIPNVITHNGIEYPVTWIGQHAFLSVSSLKRVYIPDNVLIIDDGAFQGCIYLERVLGCNGLFAIRDDAFYKCARLEKMVLPSGLGEIGTDAFGATAQKNYFCLYVNSTIPPELGKTIFTGANEDLLRIFVPCGYKEDYQAAEGWDLVADNIGYKSSDWYFDDDYWVFVEQTDGGTVNEPETVCEFPLVATPDEGYKFVEWSDGTTANPHEDIDINTLKDDIEISAIFRRICTSSKLDMISVRGEEIEGFNSDKLNYILTFPAGTLEEELPVLADVTYQEQDANQIIKKNQYGKTVIISVTNDYGLTKTYSITYVIAVANKLVVTATSNNDSWGTVTGSGEYEENTTVTITANAEKGFQFYNWNNGSSVNPYVFNITKNEAFAAQFLPESEEEIISDVQSTTAHVEMETKPWGKHGYWIWVYNDKGHSKWFCKIRFNNDGTVNKFYWGPGSKHGESPEDAPSRSFAHETSVLDAPIVLEYDLEELEPEHDYFITVECLDENDEVMSVDASSFTTAEAPSDPTAVSEQTIDSSKARKLLQNGRLIIITNDGKRYDTTGAQM